MRNALVQLLTILLLSAVCAASVTVTGHVQAADGSAQIQNTFVRFELAYCGPTQAKVPGVAILPTFPTGHYDWKTIDKTTGAFSVSLFGNDEISCNGLTGNTRWRVSYFVNNVQSPACTVEIKAADNPTYDLDNAACLETAPVVLPPIGDTTYLRLDGGNLASGTEALKEGLTPQFIPGNPEYLGAPIFDQSPIFQVGVQKLNDRLNCKLYATINACLADANTGLWSVAVVPSGTYTITSQVTVGAGGTTPVTLLLSPGAVIQCAITDGTSDCFRVADGSSIEGLASAPNQSRPLILCGTLAGGTCNVNSLVTNSNHSGVQQSFTLANVALQNTSGSALASGVGLLELQGFTGLPGAMISNVVITLNTAGIGWHIISPPNTDAGFVSGRNVRVVGNNVSGARPVLWETGGSGTTLRRVDCFDCYFSGAGDNQAILEINGNGNNASTFLLSGLTISQQTGTGFYGIKLKDANNVVINSLWGFTTTVGNELVRIAQTVPHLINSITIVGIHQNGVWPNTINDTIDSYTTAQSDIPFYTYAGDQPDSFPSLPDTVVARRTIKATNIFDAGFCGIGTACTNGSFSGSAAPILRVGTVSLTAGAATVTALPFTNTSYRCWTSDNTNKTNGSNMVPSTNSTAAVSGTGTDSIVFLCVGS